MKRVAEILSRFLRAAIARRTLAGVVLSLTPFLCGVYSDLIICNLYRFYNHEEICGKTHGRQARRQATELTWLGN